MLCPENDWTCAYFDSEGNGNCTLPGNIHLKCEFLSSAVSESDEPTGTIATKILNP